MQDWISIKTMTEAHVVGLRKLSDFSRAVDRLKAGEKTGAIETFEGMLQFFESELTSHFRHEEQALFPILGKVIGRAGPIDAMLHEHDSLWRAIDTFAELVPQLKETSGALLLEKDELISETERVARHIIWLLSSHIQKEDAMLFPLAAKVLGDPAKWEVDESIATLERIYS